MTEKERSISTQEASGIYEEHPLAVQASAKDDSPEVPTSLTARVARKVRAFDYSQIPSEAIEKAVQLILDSLACAVGSYKIETNKAMEAIFEPSGGDCLVLAAGSRGKLLEAVYLNSLAANMLDFDDAHAALGHPGATIVQPALAIAQKLGKSKRDLIEAVVAGYEFNVRWALAAFDYDAKFAGPWSLATLQSYGAVVVAGKLLDLTETEMARALYFAAANMPLPVFMKVGLLPGQTMNGLKNNYGHAAHGAVLAALTAKSSVYSDSTVLDGDQGLWRMMGAKEFHPEKVLEELGTRWDILDVQIKPYSACRWMHSSIDAMVELATGIDPGSIKRIDVYTFKSAVDALSRRNPTNLFEVQFSTPHVFGMVLMDHSLVTLQESSITDPSVIDISKKVNLILGEKYEALFKQNQLPAKVVIKLEDGTTLEREVINPKGERSNPIPREEHASKVSELIDSSPFESVKDYARALIQEIEYAAL